MTWRGTCVPPGPSIKTAGWPLTDCASAGNWARTHARSSGARSNAADGGGEVCSAIAIADILIEDSLIEECATMATQTECCDYPIRRRVQEDSVARACLC